MSLNTEQSKMAAVRLFEDAICPFNKVIGCIKAINVTAIFEKGQLDRIDSFQIPRLRPSKGMIPCLSKIEISFNC